MIKRAVLPKNHLKHKLNNIFAKRLKNLLKRNNLSQVQLGLNIGKNRKNASSSISNYANGKRLPSNHFWIKIARHFYVPPEYFVTEDDDMANLIQLWPKLTKDQKDQIISISGQTE